MFPLFVALFVSWVGAADLPWVKLAKRMGRSDTDRRNSVRSLKRIEGLPQMLIAALDGKEKYLALEVISALSVKEAVPILLPLADRDENGVVHLTLAALIDDKNVRTIEAQFLERLSSVTRKPVSVVVQVILLDTLARLGTPLDAKVLRALSLSPHPYVLESVKLFEQGRARP